MATAEKVTDASDTGQTQSNVPQVLTSHQSPQHINSDDDGGWKIFTRRRDKGKKPMLNVGSGKQRAGAYYHLGHLQEIVEGFDMEEVDPDGHPYSS